MKILVSACLLGKKVRYDGNDNYIESIEELSRKYEIIPFCPETAGGLSIPREPAEIKGSAKGVLENDIASKVLTISGNDVTNNFLEGAGKALNLCIEKGIKIAVLKSNSPSCSSSMVYDGTFSKTKVPGRGVTGELLEINGIKVFDEHNFMVLLEECD